MRIRSCTLAFALCCLPLFSAAQKNYCTDDKEQAIDCRNNFEANAYVGVAIDTFAAGEVNKYLNPDDANKIKVRGVGGFDFAYRLHNGPCSNGRQDKRFAVKV